MKTDSNTNSDPQPGKSKKKKLVFVVDDQAIYLSLLKNELQKISDVEVLGFCSGEDCLDNMTLKPKLVVLDYELDDGSGTKKNGIEVLRDIKLNHPATEVIMLSSHDEVPIATTSIKFGAYDYVVKNENAFINIKNKIKNVMRKLELIAELRQLKIIKWNIAAIVVLAVVWAMYSATIVN